MYGIEKVEDIFLILQGYSMADENHNYDYFFKEFTMFVINTGNPIDDFSNLEDVCKYYEGFNITGSMLAGNVANTYVKSYETYFAMYEDDAKDPIIIEKAMQEVIWELEHVAKTTNSFNVQKMLEPSIEVMKKILVAFKNTIVV